MGELIMLILVLLMILFYIRSSWVEDVRLNEIRNNYHQYKLLETYDVMMLKFWIWDVEKFRRKDGEVS